MKRIQRITALLLCVLMLIPTQGMSTFAETVSRIEQNEQIEEIKGPESVEVQELVEETENATEDGTQEEVQGEEVERIEEILPLEPTGKTTEGEAPKRVEETLALELLDMEEDGAIYWNPGDVVPENLLKASASEASKATASDAEFTDAEFSKATASDVDASGEAAGNDHATGRSPERPVKSLKRAISLAEKMRKKQDVDPADIIIYAMSPMEIQEGQVYAVNGGGVTIVPWEGREQKDNTIFYLTGGQLLLNQIFVGMEPTASSGEEAGVIIVETGALQLGRNVVTGGNIVLDYREEKEEREATASTAVSAASSSETEDAITPFDANKYLKDVKEERISLQFKRIDTKASLPVIELMEGFENGVESYGLEVLSDEALSKAELVRTLYADEESAENFMDFFHLADSMDPEWELKASEEITAQIRNTDSENQMRFYRMRSANRVAAAEEATEAGEGPAKESEEAMSAKRPLTRKILVATRASVRETVYWNPGPAITVSGNQYPEGDDLIYDGTDPMAPFKTWEKAAQKANGGTVISMQTGLMEGILIQEVDGYALASPSLQTRVTVSAWEANPQPILYITDGDQLILRNVEMTGLVKEGVTQNQQMILSDGGDVRIEEGVIAEHGYIQVNASAALEAHPITVGSSDNGIITLFFGGINDNLVYRYADVIVPTGELAQQAQTDPVTVGQQLLSRFRLEKSNRSEEHGGKSRFDWHIRVDTEEDDSIGHSEKLELYTDYYFSAVYLDGVRGEDGAFGATCQYPVKTWGKAKEIWQREMERSIAARTAAAAAGRNSEYIERMYPVPSKIYICGTVTVDALETWSLKEYTDYNGNPIVTQVESHIDIPLAENSTQKVHELPKTLVSVSNGGVLTIKDMIIRNITEEKDSNTIEVMDGAELVLDSQAVLTGEIPAAPGQPGKTSTYGTHILVSDGGTLNLSSGWKGQIEKRQHGIVATGSRASVEMNGGSVSENNSFDPENNTPDYAHAKGSGVIIKDGADFTMNGGKISKNKVYQYGAGVYLEGEGSSFTLKGGEVSENDMAQHNRHSSTPTKVLGYGIGIYAGEGTEVTLQSTSGQAEAAAVKGNHGYYVYGSGIYAAGKLTINPGSVSDNTGYPAYGGEKTNYVCKGIGIYLTGTATLDMDGGLISGNRIQSAGPSSAYDACNGAGIYMESTVNSHLIKNSKILENKIGYCTQEQYNSGGGIYMTDQQDARITNTEISKNKAYYGAGIYIRSESGSVARTKVTIENSSIKENTASYSSLYPGVNLVSNGYGGGICSRYSEINLNEGSVISGNSAYNGGGIYVEGWNLDNRSDIHLKGTALKPIRIQNNLANNGGGGIFSNRYAMIHGEHTEIEENTATQTGGGVYLSSISKTYFRDVSISANMATNSFGGGVYIGSNGIDNYWQDMKVVNNMAGLSGGGIYSFGNLYISETKPGTSQITGNTARDSGGGIYGANGAIMLDIAGPYQNKAGKQGSNIYNYRTALSLYQGSFIQPLEVQDGVYNLYINMDSGVLTRLDPSKVSVEKKVGEHADAIYLNTARSFLTYLTAPENENSGTLQIDVNTDIFKVGTVVIKPANTSSTDIWVPTADLKAAEPVKKSYPTLKDATINLGYSSGGLLPRRTQLGGYRDSNNSTLTNVVLVGEGVYLASENMVSGVNVGGDDGNGGTGPSDAVATFAKAKSILETRITSANTDTTDTDGFSPFIYICGPVKLTGTQTWELAHDSDLFTITNADYINAEKEEGKTAYPAQIRRFASFVRQPMIQVGMTHDDTTALNLEKIIINGMAEAVIIGDQSNRSPILQVMGSGQLQLNGESQIANNYECGIVAYGKIILDGEEGETNKQLLNHWGYGIRLQKSSDKKGSLLMKGHSRIVRDENAIPGSTKQYGVELLSDTSMVMEEYSQIVNETKTDFSYGIYLSGAGTVLLKDDAAIKNINSYGIRMNRDNGTVKMEGRSSILTTDGIDSQYGVSIAGADNSFTMNGNADASDTDSAVIQGATRGVESRGLRNQIELKKKAVISGKTYSVFVDQTSSSVDEADQTKLLLRDASSIGKGSNYGIYIEREYSPFYVEMSENAAIEGCTNGISESNPSSSGLYGSRYFSLLMKDNARISGNSSTAIYFKSGRWSNGYYQKIHMQDNAIIGGPTKYNRSDMTSGNGGDGIYTVKPLNLIMEGESGIINNAAAGIRTGSTTDSDDQTLGTILLKDKASIRDNGDYGIQATTYAETARVYSRPFHIMMQGETEISGSKLGNYLNSWSSWTLEDSAKIGKPTGSSPSAFSLNAYGKLYLSGSSDVEGQIRLQKPENPIVMTKGVTDPIRRYHLSLSEGFLGKAVVTPDQVTMTTVTSQLPYFIKDQADGLAQGKHLVKMEPDIVLQGENNVYLSGSGKDVNDGNSPSTPVRTFKRAKELLQTGYYTEGANVLISGEVAVMVGDEEWSFDAGGTVTNEITGQTWKPLVKRYKQYVEGNLIIANSNSPSKLLFHDITIDGGSKDGLINYSSSDSYILYLQQSKSALLGQGAVLQNNKRHSSFIADGGSGVYASGATLEIDGGIIRNMEYTCDAANGVAYVVGAAVYLKNVGPSSPSKLIFKSGLITENRLNAPKWYSGDGAAVAVDGNYTFFEMSGGSIQGNTVIKQDGNTSYGGAVALVRGNANITGGSIKDNKGAKGSAITYTGEREGHGLILSGGQITGNQTNIVDATSQGAYSPVYIAGSNFQLKGGGCNVADNIYLDSTVHVIKLSGNIYQSGRQYNVFLNQGPGSKQFQKGSVVVEPDGNWLADASAFLPYFEVHSNPYVLDRGQTSILAGTVPGVAEKQCLLLMKSVYLDSEKGADTQDGTTPAKAVKTFSRAKQVGMSGEGGTDYYIIFVTGKAVNTAAETVWTLPAPSYLCRYTGFPVYNEDGSETEQIEHKYSKFLIEPAFDLTFQTIAVYGRRSIDTLTSNGDSLVHIKEGIHVTLEQDPGKVTTFGRNNNIGEYYNYENSILENLTSKGGAFQIDGGGSLTMKGGSIHTTDAAYGSAIHVGVDKEKGTKGEFLIDNDVSVDGKVHLTGSGADISSYVSVGNSFLPPKRLQISIENDYGGREVIQYPEGTKPGYEEQQNFQFDDSIQALYNIINRTSAKNILELEQRGVLYLDGQNGDDSKDGSTPDNAFKTVERAYKSIANSTKGGTVIYVVGTVDVSSAIMVGNIEIREEGENSRYEGFYEESGSQRISVKGQVYFKRYSQPTAHADLNGFEKETLLDPLFRIKNSGVLTLNGIYMDGHSEAGVGSDPTVVADGVLAHSPILSVEEGGELNSLLMELSGFVNGVETATLLTNNVNVNRKTNQIGTLDGAEILEGSGSGIEILGGRVNLERTEFSNMKLGNNVVSGGTDVYNKGELHIKNKTLFSGTVFLEGLGTVDDIASHASSHYIYVDVMGTPVKNDFQVLMRDPYAGRTVVEFIPAIPQVTQVANYRLEEIVKDFFYLVPRESNKKIFELQVPSGVYVDGMNGDDTLDNIYAGSTPDQSVKSLRRAFELLKTRAGNTIYIVDTVKISQNTVVTGSGYQDASGGGNIQLGSTNKVTLLRYIQPDFAKGNEGSPEVISAGYTSQDFTGTLFEIENGATLSMEGNVFIDGHSEPRDDERYPAEVFVSRKSESKAPLVRVKEGGILDLLTNSALQNNQNTFDAETEIQGIEGGAIYNSGTVTVRQAEFLNITAKKGSAAYQDGVFTVESGVEKLDGYSFYLTTENFGTIETPVWGTEHILQIGEKLPVDQKLDIDMDYAVKGRGVIKFTDVSAYDTTADSEHTHFTLGSTVPDYLFLMGSALDDSLLELQNYERLDVEVPADMYLVINRRGSIESSTRLGAVQSEAAGTDLLTAPVYTINNKGDYTVKVSVSGFENKNTESGILHDTMILRDTAELAAEKTDLYLAIKGEDTVEGFVFEETSLKPYAETIVTADPTVLGTLQSGKSGTFTFIGSVGSGFVDHYLDSTFPIEGKTKEEVQDYLDGKNEAGIVNARARYALKYRIDIVPSRR